MHRDLLTFPVLALALLSGVVARAQSPVAQPPVEATGEPPVAAASSPAASEVELIDGGREPRRELRYDFADPQPESMVMDMDMRMKIDAGERVVDVDLPTMRMRVSLDEMRTTDEGNLRYRFELDEAEVLEEEGGDPRVARAMREGLAKARGMGGSETVTPRGRKMQIEVNVPEGVDQRVRQQVEQLQKAMEQVPPPLPREAVGPGAKWRTEVDLENVTPRLRQTATYTLERFDGDAFVLRLHIQQDAPRQTIEAASGQKVELTSLDGRGMATLVVHPDRLVPQRARIHLDMSMKMAVEGAAGGEMSTDVTADMTIRPAEEVDAAEGDAANVGGEGGQEDEGGVRAPEPVEAGVVGGSVIRGME